MVSSHLAQLIIIYPLRLSLSILKCGLSIFKIYLFGLDVRLDPLYLLLLREQIVLHLLLILVLQLLDARLKVVDVGKILISFSLRDQELV